jgi:hypothetical protein
MLTNQTGYGLLNDDLHQVPSNAKALSFNLKVSMKKQGLATGENISDNK